MATNSPCRVTAFTCCEAGCERNGEAGKWRPLRICVAVTSSTYTLGKLGSMLAGGTRASSSRSSAAKNSSCAIVCACSICKCAPGRRDRSVVELLHFQAYQLGIPA